MGWWAWRGLWLGWLGWAWWSLGLAQTAGLGALGLGVAFTGYRLGQLLRARLQPGLLASELCRAAPGEPRLAALRRLVDWLRPSQPRWSRVAEDLTWREDFPDGFFASLFGCLLEGGLEAASLLLDLLAAPFFDAFGAGDRFLSVAAREELFSEASLARLHAFFVHAKDPTVLKAFLRLHRIPSNNLLLPKSIADAHLGSADVDQGLLEHIGPAFQEQFKRHNNFLRDRDFLDKARGLLRGGDPDQLFWDLRQLYATLHSRDYGVQYLLRPLLPELARRWEELPEGLKRQLVGLRVVFRPWEGPAEARDAVEDCAVPLLRDAHRIPLDCLRWLTHFEEHVGEVEVVDGGHETSPYAMSDGWELRLSFLKALARAVGRSELNADQAWFLVGGGEVVSMGTVGRDVGLRPALLRAWWREPLSGQHALAAARALQDLLRLPGRIPDTNMAAKGFAMLHRLLDLYLPPEQPGADSLTAVLINIVQRTQEILEGMDGEVRAAVAATLVGWEDLGLGPALRRFLRHDRLSDYLRHNAQALLALHDGLLPA